MLLAHASYAHDLTTNFSVFLYKARALGRGGSAAANLKRYDIGRVYHKSMAEGHPRETMEASFDVIEEDVTRGFLSEAETIFVACQVMALLPRREVALFTFKATTPLWYLRIGHTKLADAILDLCDVPQKEAIRSACLHILTRLTAPPPYAMRRYLASSKKKSGGITRQSFDEVDPIKILVSLLNDAVSKHHLPRFAAEKLRVLVESCMPLPPDLEGSIECLKNAVTALRGLNSTGLDPRRLKRFEDAARSLKSVKDLLSTLDGLDVKSLVSSVDSRLEDSVSRPLYVSLDLGLRQRRKHYHGGFIFQCIVLPDAFFEQMDPSEHNEVLISSTGRGIKVAEAGTYSDLVRKHRPPGNFATAFVNYYTAAPIPYCTGIRFSIGKIVELLYLDAACSKNTSLERWNELSQRPSVDNQGMDLLRQSLGHPLQYAETVNCKSSLLISCCRKRLLTSPLTILLNYRLLFRPCRKCARNGLGQYKGAVSCCIPLVGKRRVGRVSPTQWCNAQPSEAAARRSQH